MTNLDDTKTLACALIWLRNHYELGDKKHSGSVLATIDQILDRYPVKLADMKAFREQIVYDEQSK